jgi:uncharacterized protein (DUF305 family)
MRNPPVSFWIGGMLAVAAACGPPTSPPPTPSTVAPGPSPSVLERAARADSVRHSYTRADVDFMIGMIHHHAQALVMSHMATTHDASPELRTLAARIINGQKDEIALMQQWLRDRGEPVPEIDDEGHVIASARDHGGHDEHGNPHAHGPGGAHDMHMAGMLTPQQLERLDQARGAEWDRLFLTYMIQHHQGALVMVEELFATHGAAQGDAIFKIAADIGADQSSEIDRMQRMLQALLFGSGTPH